MIFRPLQPNDYLYSCWIRSKFEDGSVGFGTGFLISSGGGVFAATARHVVDDGLKPPLEKTRGAATKVEIGCWSFEQGVGNKHHRIEISGPHFNFCGNQNDLAAISFAPKVVREILRKRVQTRELSSFAAEEELGQFYPGLPVYICGYSEGSPTLEAVASQLPFMRQCVIATPLAIPFSPPKYLGKDYSYIDGYALGGFSGSPVHMPQCGLPPGRGLNVTPYWPSKIVGIVVRRVNTNEESQAGSHAGLSCIVRSTSIINLISDF